MVAVRAAGQMEEAGRAKADVARAAAEAPAAETVVVVAAEVIAATAKWVVAVLRAAIQAAATGVGNH